MQVHPGSLKSKMGGAALVSGLKALAGQAAVPVLVHLDHAGEEEWPRALELGMDSVMADGSDLGDDANAEMTASAVEAARARGMGTEAELGRLTGTEDGVTVEVSERGPEVRILAGAMRTSLLIADSRCETQEYLAKLTDPSQACAFVKRTRCDALAVCVGNVHGKYPPSGPRIDLDRLLAISHAMAAMGESRAELVLHGASGLPRETVEACIRAGVAKFNVNTELRAAYVRALGEEGELVPVMEHANAAMRVVVREKLELFGCVGRV